ncbi:hypothetical protein FSP39_006877 [Pinctada imbricata]|uniref:Major facilitator superfamily (MFS) profile domain-containing protein n=1 Tax=Pinctada imbricata TaxID=66713 RepID=A0AA88XYC4_PINIB|nr:hypothetical protein FSP39_006877 [Pinctada imbricata]
MPSCEGCSKDCHYGWVVVVAAALIRILVYGISYTSGVVYVVIIENFNTKRGETAWIASILTAVTFLVSPLSGVLLNRFGYRAVTFLGGILCFVGLALSQFVKNLILLCFTYGIITGIGCGLAYMPCSVAVSKYFNRRLNLAMGIASAGGGLGSFIFPPIIGALNDQYGWQGMFLILAAISLNICVLGLFFKPFSSGGEQQKTLDSDKTIRNSGRVKNDWSFLRMWQFYIIQANAFLYGFGTSIVYGHLGAYAHFHLGLSHSASALLYSAVGVSVTVCKILQGLTADFGNKCCIFKPIVQLIVFFFIGGLVSAFLPIITVLPGLILFSVVFGSSYAACGGSIIPSLLISLKGKDQLSLTYGVSLANFAVGQLLGAPAAGWIYDIYGSYNVPFVVAGVCMMISALVMIVPYRSSSFAPQNEEIAIPEQATSTSEEETKQLEMSDLTEMSFKGSKLSILKRQSLEESTSLLEEKVM